MKVEPINILLVEDDPAHAMAIMRALQASTSAVNVQMAGTLTAFRQAVAVRQPDLAIMDLNLPDGRALEVLTSPPEAGPFPVLIMTSYGNERVAVEALKAGALDYVTKSPEAFLGMPHSVERARREWALLQERRQTEKAIRASLTEKEILLKEMHHRVKNNLMTIIGLIKMHEAKVTNKTFNLLLQELEGRIRSMALVHEMIHNSRDLAHIDLQDFIATLSAHIRARFGVERDIRFQVRATGMEVDLNTAAPCGLILNELITNAFKHAFPKDKPRRGEGICKITVAVKQDGGACTLTVSDNGVGLPEGTNWENPETLGLGLVKMLSQQINGSIELDRSAGTVFRLRF